ncbi:MAG: ATP-binding cassette domain-containing protein [Christensenellales bacterium]|jgi:putative multiple sugar transport system ATP-binding protein
MASTMLEMRAITKQFPGVTALDNVNLLVQEGEIHALVGENGAGKSTLMNVLSGIHPHGAYEGEIIYLGEVCRHRSIRDSEKLGIVIIHQELALVPYLSIAENMFLGNERAKHGVISWDKTNDAARRYMDMVGLAESPQTLIKDIGTGKQQLVEIAKALAKNVKLLILDEPTSSLNEVDSKKLLDLLIEFQKNRGITSIIISHKLGEIAYVADKITVLRDGAVIETLDNRGAEHVSEARIIRGMVGREMVDRFPRRTPNIGEKAFEIENWSVYHPLYTERKVVDDVSIHVRKGEVVGIAGLIGAGRTELCMSVFGRAYGTGISGTVKKDGAALEIKTIPDAIRAGIAYVTEDRKGDGLVLSNSLKHNVSLSRMAFVSRRGVIDKDAEVRAAEKAKADLRIKAPHIEIHVDNLSGGNQQKTLIGKWMFAEPEVMMLDEPTRGIDVNAKYEIYTIINDLVAKGKCVLMISSELPELIGMCDRIYVMCEGRLVGEVARENATQEHIMNLIMQASKGDVKDE